jgi:hypothetical protein
MIFIDKMLKKNKNIIVSSLNCLFFNIIIIADIEKKIITNSIMYLGEVVTKFEKLLDWESYQIKNFRSGRLKF